MAKLPDLHALSSLGTGTIPLTAALPHAGRARAVEWRGEDVKDLEKLARIFRLKVIALEHVPTNLGALQHLRSLTILGQALHTVPSEVFALPRLETLFLEATQLESLDGLEHSTSLETVIFRNTPLAENHAAREQLLARLSAHGWAADSTFRTSGFSRKRASAALAPKDKATLMRAINEDLVPNGTTLTDADLSGGTFEDALLEWCSLQQANLKNTTWRRCDLIRTNLEGANLEGAVFEECVFDEVKMADAKAAGATFKRCLLRLDLRRADLTGATFTENEACPHLSLKEAKAQRMLLEVLTLSESSLDVELEGSDLRGATIRVDITPQRRAELEAKPNARVKWAKLDTSTATMDDATLVALAPLPGAKPTKAAKKVVAKAEPVKADVESVAYVGRLDATNAALWFLAMDAKEAAAWKGEDEAEFDRALDIESGAIKVGPHRGVLAQLGDCGWSHVWRAANGDLLLVEHQRSGTYSKLPKEDQIAALRTRIASFPVPKKSTSIGKLSVNCGVLALMLPYCNGDFTEEQLSTATLRGDGRLLVPVPNGDYKVSSYPFAARDFEDELGSYGDVTRIARVTTENARKTKTT